MLARDVQELCQEWERRARTLPVADHHWRYSRQLGPGDPGQGWKLHLSATIVSASAVFDRVASILLRRGVLFKIPGRLEFLHELNSGLVEFSQIGKFLTVYPRWDAQARQLCSELHDRTRRLAGPEVPFDERYRPGGLVYYRYGAFRPTPGSSNGKTAFIFDAGGRRHRDVRGPGLAVPSWMTPLFFSPHGKQRKARACRKGPLGVDLLPFKAISQRGKGGVYEALDVSRRPARLCVVKEGRRHGETQWDGSDGYSRIRHEANVLTQLRSAGAPVPEALAHFRQEGNYYLILPKLQGCLLLKKNQQRPKYSNWRRAERLLKELSSLLGGIHALGWVWRDCKPWNLMCDKGNLWALDFEGACRAHETEAMPWGSWAYTPPVYRESFVRKPGTIEDDYASGVIAFQFATGVLPPPTSNGRFRLLKASGCPAGFRERLESLIGSEEASA